MRMDEGGLHLLEAGCGLRLRRTKHEFLQTAGDSQVPQVLEAARNIAGLVSIHRPARDTHRALYVCTTFPHRSVCFSLICAPPCADTVREHLGKGGFGSVYCCEDIETHRLVAVKVVDAEAYRDMLAEYHITYILQRLGAPYNHCVRCYGWFRSGVNTCFVYDVLGPSLKKVLKANPRGLPLYLVREMGRQLFQALAGVWEG